MIKNWTKYEAYRERLINTIRFKFSNVADDTFYDLFQEAYLEKFVVFESSYDSSKSKNEIGFLYRLVYNKVIDLLKKQLPHSKIQSEIKDNEIELLESEITQNSFAGFLFNMLTNRGGLKVIDLENIKDVKKKYKMVTPIVRMEAWARKEPLSTDSVIKLTENISSDSESSRFYDWTEPTPIMRLQCWVGCS